MNAGRVVFFMEQGVGGAERVALEYASWLAGHGWQVDVVAGGTLDERARKIWREWGGGLSVTEISWRRRTEYRFPVILPSLDSEQNGRLASLLRGIRPDVVVVNQPGPDSAQGAIRAATNALPEAAIVPLVHQAPVKLIRMRLKALKLWWCRRIYLRLGRVLAVSQACADSLVEDHGIPGDRVDVVRNGVKDVGPAPSHGELLRARRELGVADGQIAVLWIGRVSADKGIDILARAAGLLARVSPQVRVFAVGEGPLMETIARENTEAISSGALKLLGWRWDTRLLLHACDMAAMPSRIESFGLFIAEAMAAGKPVVATRIYGIPDVVADGETGILVPPEDPAALAWAIERLAGDRGAREAMGRAGRRRYEAKFAFETAAARFEKALQEVLAGRMSLERTA